VSTIKSSAEDLTLNADGSGNDIKFQSDGVEKASINSSGAFTSTTIDATALTGNLPAIDGSSLTGIQSPLVEGTDYLAPDGDGSSLTGIQSPLVEGTDYLAPDGDGSNLTGINTTTDFSSLTDTTVATVNPEITTNPSAVGHIWFNKTTGNIFTCTRNVSDENIWINNTDNSGHVMYQKGQDASDFFGDGSDRLHLRMDQRIASAGTLRDWAGNYTVNVDPNVQFTNNSKFWAGNHNAPSGNCSASFHGNGEIRVPFMSGVFTRSSNFTVSLWITRKGNIPDGWLPFSFNGTSSTKGRGVMVKDNAMYRVAPTYAPYTNLNTTAELLGTTFTVNDGDHFIVIGYSDASNRLYKNGSIVDTTGPVLGYHSNESNSAGGCIGGMGRCYNPTGFDQHIYFNCAISNFRIFNKAVNSTEAAELYAEGY
jgi:hypothetical protein